MFSLFIFRKCMEKFFLVTLTMVGAENPKIRGCNKKNQIFEIKADSLIHLKIEWVFDSNFKNRLKLI